MGRALMAKSQLGIARFRAGRLRGQLLDDGMREGEWFGCIDPLL
jgi:hypothetical protein